jgi:hypothetical protein
MLITGGERSLFTELGSLGIKELERYPSTQDDLASVNGSFGITGFRKRWMGPLLLAMDPPKVISRTGEQAGALCFMSRFLFFLTSWVGTVVLLLSVVEI